MQPKTHQGIKCKIRRHDKLSVGRTQIRQATSERTLPANKADISDKHTWFRICYNIEVAKCLLKAKALDSEETNDRTTLGVQQIVMQAVAPTMAEYF